MAIKGGDSTFSKAPELEPHYQMRHFVLYVGNLFGGGGLAPLQKCSQYVLQPQPTGLWTKLVAFHFVLMPLEKA